MRSISRVTVAGVELNNNTAPNTKRTKILDVETCRIFAIHTKTRNYSRQNGETVAGVRLDNNTASTKQSERWIYMTSKPTKNEKTDPSNFRKYTRKWGVNHGETVAGAALRQQHRSTKPEKKKTVLKCLFKWARHWVDSLVLRWAACFIKKRRDYQL